MVKAKTQGLLSSSAILLLGLFVLTGCGVGNRYHSVVWTATLDTLPDAACARDAIASVPEISGAKMNPRPGGYVFGAHLRNGSVSGPDILIVVIREGRDPLQFRMRYGDSRKLRVEHESAARAIIDRLSTDCFIPELRQRARETHESEWMPYFFNN